jgi:hypothetical protein
MPLTRDKIIGHDLERLAFRFTMLNDGEVVQCQISDAAMDELAGMQGTESSARQAQFLSLRETIERIASDLYDEAPRFQGYVVRIFMRHLGGSVALFSTVIAPSSAVIAREGGRSSTPRQQ